jgi:hypothetical protein
MYPHLSLAQPAWNNISFVEATASDLAREACPVVARPPRASNHGSPFSFILYACNPWELWPLCAWPGQRCQKLVNPLMTVCCSLPRLCSLVRGRGVLAQLQEGSTDSEVPARCPGLGNNPALFHTLVRRPEASSAPALPCTILCALRWMTLHMCTFPHRLRPGVMVVIMWWVHQCSSEIDHTCT